MEKLGLNEIRKKFLDFFESKDHYVKNSYSLVPQDDKSLLLVNAGMAPLKKFFTGTETPPNTKMATCQKCIRTGDIENVGKTARHATFFEMLGNFSFGDYFKKESLKWGWEFCVDVLEMPVEDLWVTVYLEDDQAYNIWKDHVGVPEDRIIRLGKEHNFWEIGTGPCGPCAEMYYDRGEDYECLSDECLPGDDGDRFIEFWNHVFTQYDKDENGVYHDLKNPNIDTGMGLERIAAIMQDVESIFEVDTIKTILDSVVALTDQDYGETFETDVSFRIITDHVRAVTFMVGDGIMPNNEGRGYVLRRLLRRASRHGKLLGIKGSFLANLADVVIDTSKEAYPTLEKRRDYIKKIISIEEERFQKTIDQGIEILDRYIEDLKAQGQTTLAGKKAFKLYDTYGFPLDLTKEILEEHEMTVDEETFEQEMEKQRTRARAAHESKDSVGWQENLIEKLGKKVDNEFLGYDHLNVQTELLGIINKNESVDLLDNEEDAIMILSNTPFYAESGGQVGDQGIIKNEEFEFIVEDTQYGSKGLILHKGYLKEGLAKVNATVKAKVDKNRRMAIAKNHTTTHLLHKSLKKVLGDHVDQAGSLVDEQHFRFDFTHFESLTDQEIREIEMIVNQKIAQAMPIEVIETSLEQAEKLGATALFGEKYEEDVRIIKIDEFSMELCGGTHLTNTAQAGIFKILNETAVAAGVRRIEATTSLNVLELINQYEDTIETVANVIKTNKNDVVKKAESLVKENKALRNETEELKKKLASSNLDDVIKEASEEINNINTIIAKLNNVDGDTLRELSDRLLNENPESFILLASLVDDKVIFVAKASKTLLEKGIHCGNIVREVASITKGGGGGRPAMAQAGGSDQSKVDEALAKAKKIIVNL